MKLVVNGREETVNPPSTVAKYIESAGWKPTQVVVEYNGKVLARQRLDEVSLQEGDRLEIVIPVAGG